MSAYATFLERKRRVAAEHGITASILPPQFAGIGSEGYESIRLGRKFVGFELKTQYAEVAARNLRAAERANDQQSLFSASEMTA
jgi:hypothetical protein